MNDGSVSHLEEYAASHLMEFSLSLFPLSFYSLPGALEVIQILELPLSLLEAALGGEEQAKSLSC